MKRYSKLGLALAGATVVLAAMVGTASANRLSINSSTFRVAWNSMEFNGTNFGSVRCPVTLEGSLHSRTISKVAGALIGFISRASVASGNCTGGTARANTETLPWHVQYASFTEALPTITSILTTIREPVFEVAITFVGQCRMRASSIQGRFIRETARGTLTRVEVNGTSLLERTISGFCPPEGTLTGTSNPPTVLGTTTPIVVTLI
jgi:hypothetical protein